MQLWQCCLLVTARSLYMFRTFSASIIRSTKKCSNSHWYMPWVGIMYIQQRCSRSVVYLTMSKVGCLLHYIQGRLSSALYPRSVVFCTMSKVGCLLHYAQGRLSNALCPRSVVYCTISKVGCLLHYVII